MKLLSENHICSKGEPVRNLKFLQNYCSAAISTTCDQLCATVFPILYRALDGSNWYCHA
jgi:hypothetical protein